ncbi:glycosyltransferase family 9 protein [Oxalobacteraceae bacterium]|nr:glycosyltransferase family 9 protein [Oxalobacteraceae bacterium]
MSIKPRATLPRKVLFLSQDGKLGDAIVNTAFVAALHRAAPDCVIHATVAGVTAPFWQADARIARCWPLQRPGWIETVRAGRALRREQYDAIVTWQPLRKEKNKLLLWLAGAGQVIDLRDFNRGPLHHKIDACGAVLAQLGVPVPVQLGYDIGMPAHSADIDALLPAGREVIVVNLFAADAERTIAPDDAQQMLRALHAVAPQAALALVCTAATLAVAQQVAQSVAGAQLESAAQDGAAQEGVAPDGAAQDGAMRTVAAQGSVADRGAVSDHAGAKVTVQVLNCEGDLPKLLRLCQRADLVISPDTALIHIASAYDTAVIGIYQNNGIKAVQWGPRSRLGACVLSNNPFSIAGFSVAEVAQQARSLRTRYLEQPQSA